jgi:predicted nucleic acid-binding Zn ribbon protein
VVPRKRKKRRRDFETIGVVLGREKPFKGVAADVAPISDAAWEAAVGTRIAARAKPKRLDRGVLLVATATSAWSNELSLLAAPILEKLRAQGLDVRELRFRVGPLEPVAKPPRRPAKLAPRAVALSPVLRRSLDHVPDDELRAAIEAAAKKALGFAPE